MRTTVTLEADVARLVHEAMHREHASFKAVVNAAIRRGLSPSAARAAVKRYRVEPHSAQLAPGLDPRALNRLADEVEDVVPKATKRRRA